MSGFSQDQLRKLSKLLDRRHVQSRALDGRKLDYIEGWFAIAEANAIFGFSGWDRQMCYFERVFERVRGDEVSCGYVARVRLRVRAGEILVVREGTGWGSATARAGGEAYERALKSAETDATKRALATFGNRFGLGLYDKEQAGVTPLRTPDGIPKTVSHGFSLTAPDGALLSHSLSPEGFCSALRQMAESGLDRSKLFALRDLNKAMLERLRSEAPALISAKGVHFADILERLMAKRAGGAGEAQVTLSPASKNCVAAAATSTANVEPPKERGTGAQSELPNHIVPDSQPSRIGDGVKIEKHQLQFASERRVRNKMHLALVASRPCLICEELPCHAHHITFAQRRGFSVKVSDEFTVPLCAVRHNEAHAYGSERAWWTKHGVEPLIAASELWREFLTI